MNSNALLRLQSDYGSDSDTDDHQIKPQTTCNTETDLNLTSIDLNTNCDNKTEISAVTETHHISDVITDSITDTDIKPELIPEVEAKPYLNGGSKPNFNENVDLNEIERNSSYQRMVVDDSCNEIDISSDSSSSTWSLSSDESHEEIDERKVTKSIVKTKGELSFADLPPIENLTISVGVEELSQLGRVVSTVDQLVIVQSFRLMPALDLDSVLFFKDGQPLGRIFDVFGPVVEPRYAVRFNNAQQITDLKISVDTPVYFAAEQKQPITGFVFAEQLRRMKGSDASWKHNNEPPEEMVEYSDDESERIHKQKLNSKRSYTQRSSKFKSNIFSLVAKQS